MDLKLFKEIQIINHIKFLNTLFNAKPYRNVGLFSSISEASFKVPDTYTLD
jgi:hypothetical protein